LLAHLTSSPHPVAEPIRVMVVDDSAVVRGLIARALESDPGVRVVGRAADGEAAIRALAGTPVDLVVLDIEMPVMDGLTALPHLLAARPGVKVIMASTLTQRNARAALEALRLGASDYVAKPQGGSLVHAEDFNRELLAKVRALGGCVPPLAVRAAPTPAPVRRAARPEVIVLGGSTGAPPVLMEIFEGLRGAETPPILVAQHMPPTFTALLAEQLARSGERPCAEAQDGEPIRPGRAYVAPGGWHMLAARGAEGPVIRLNQDPAEHFCRPAVDPLLRSVAETYGAGALAVILTGMGSDGAEGCRVLSGAGGRFAVQDEASSAVWGMPGAASRAATAENILPGREIGAWLRRVAS
jgi:two-component system chemotaxis response regulator CheB